MRLFPPEPVIAPDEGFTPEKDIFGYAKFGEQLRDFYASFDDPLVGVLDAPWGSGKSTFIKMWCGHMRNAGYPIIEFDAFKNDFTDDAFIALAGEVLAVADDHGITYTERSAFKDVATRITVAAAKGIFKKGIEKVCGEEGFEEVVSAATGASDALFESVQGRLENRKNERQLFDDFGITLQEIAKKMSGDNGNPLIFVIDELDRCKPPFALALLEKIKHFFSVPNVQFLLVTNLDQLSKVVKCEYGSEIDGQTYLHKFYDISFGLPVQNALGTKEVLEVFCHYVQNNCGSGIADSLVFMDLAKTRNLQLRTLVKIHAYAASVQLSRNAPLGVWYLVVGLAFMRVLAPEFFVKAVHGGLSMSEVENFFVGEEEIDILKCCMLFCLKNGNVELETRKTASKLFNGVVVAKNSVEEVAQQMATTHI